MCKIWYTAGALDPTQFLRSTIIIVIIDVQVNCYRTRVLREKMYELLYARTKLSTRMPIIIDYGPKFIS